MSPVWRPNCAPMLGAADKFYSLFFIDLYLFDLDQYIYIFKKMTRCFDISDHKISWLGQPKCIDLAGAFLRRVGALVRKPLQWSMTV